MLNFREDLRLQIGKIQRELEDVYVGIGQEYSQLRQAMDSQLASSIKVVKEFKSRVVSSEESLIGTVQSVERFIQESIKSYEGMDKESEELVAIFKKSFSSIEQIMEHIRQIRDASELMEVLALNAMVVAINSGKNGGGFTFISDALKNSASTTIRLSDEVLAIGLSIRETYDNVNNMLENIVFLNSDLNTFFTKTIRYQFQQFYTLTRTYIDFVEQLYYQSEKVKEPVFAIMQDLQYQDILRQSLDHIIVFIDELPQYTDSDAREQLDELEVLQILNDFAEDILSEVREKVQENLKGFRARIAHVQQVSAEIGKMQKEFMEQHTGEVRVSDNMHDVILEFRNGMTSLLQDLKEGELIKASLKQEEARLFSMIHTLNQKAGGFEALTNTFGSIIVLGRIEISKMESLKDVSSVMQDIDINTDAIDHSISVINELYSDMNQFDKQIRELFETLFSAGTNRAGELVEQFDIVEKLLTETFEGLIRVVDGFSFFSDEFYTMAGKTSHKIEGLKLVLDQVDGLLAEGKEVGREIDEHRSELLKELNISSWKLRFDGIDDIVKKFTVYRHRKNAQEISGVSGEGAEVKETLQEGTISLF